MTVKVYSFIEARPGCKSSEISVALEIPLPTVKRMLGIMVINNLIFKEGIGTGTSYFIAHLETSTFRIFDISNLRF